ncbi:MAG: hypothetical protein ACYSSI_06025 [Planctomycetota bacterium]|jgi:hypothetical protein
MTKKNILLAIIFFELVFISSHSSVSASDKIICESEPVKVVRLKLQCKRSDTIDSIADIFQRQVRQRCGAVVKTFGTGDLTVEFAIDNSIGKEGFKIEDSSDNTIRIVGNNERGLLYGIGKFLRTSQYSQNGFIPGNWRGTSVPVLPVRGIYFASHFRNYYVTAPQEELHRYVEELALWGHNTIMIWYDLNDYAGFDDPGAVKFRKLMGRMLERVKNLGIDVGFLESVNEGYTSTPNHLRQTKTRIPGYSEICPSKPEGMNLILKNFTQMYEWYAGFSPRYICLWNYDSGGCDCEQCKPWASNGFIRTAKDITKLTREKFPDTEIMLSTWVFNEQEWQELLKKYPEKSDWDWIDYILTYSGTLRLSVKHGFLKSSYLNFPEITSCGAKPWVAYGANPKPVNFQGAWNVYRPYIKGIFPYSEGIHEDLNKVINTQLCWDPNRTTMDITKEYIRYEYSPKVVDEVLEAIKILETNYFKQLNRNTNDFKNDAEENAVKVTQEDLNKKLDKNKHTYDFKHKVKESALKAYELIKSADAKLDARTKNSWRWRILYLRALIDSEIFKNDSLKGQTMKEAFEELIEIYHAQKALWPVKPPIKLTQ